MTITRRRSWPTSAALLFATFLLAGCGGSTAGTPSATRSPTSATPTATATATATPIARPPAMPAVYVASADGHVTALNPADGSVRWRNTLPSMPSDPVATPGIVYVQSSGLLAALRADSGATLWSVPTQGSFTVNGTTVYTLTNTANPSGAGTTTALTALDAVTGHVRWTWDGPATGQISQFLAVGDIIYALSMTPGSSPQGPPSNTGLTALNARDGSPRWTYQRPGELLQVPRPSGGTIYILSAPTTGGPAHLTALRAADGSAVWTKETSQLSSLLAVAGGHVYGRGPRGVYALGTSDGAVVWEYEGFNIVNATASGKLLYVTTSKPSVLAFDTTLPYQPSLLWATGGGNLAMPSYPPVVAGGTLYLPTRSRSDITPAPPAGLYALETSKGTVRWRNTASAAIGDLVVRGDTIYEGTLDQSPVVYALAASTGAVRWKYPVETNVNQVRVVVG